MSLDVEITRDDLSDGRVISLLQEHRQEMLKHSPLDSVHALDVAAMHALNLSFWSATINDSMAGCVGLKQLDSTHAELKSMKVSDAFVGKGVGRALLDHVLLQAKQLGCKRLSLETGSMRVFIPARSLYESVGFVLCSPFDGYVYDSNSVCMSLEI
jgi:putative acetyltransferase